MSGAAQNRKGAKRLCAAGLLLVLCAMSGALLRPAYAEASLTQLEQELAALEEQIALAKLNPNGEAELQRCLERRSENLSQQIEAVNRAISTAQTALREKENVQAQKALQLAQAKHALGLRLREMYFLHNQGAQLEAALGVQSWGEMLRYRENLTAMTRAETKAIEALETRQRELAQQNEDVEADIAILLNSQTLLAEKSAEYAESLRDSQGLSTEEAAALADTLAYAARYERKAEAETRWADWLSGETAPHILFGGGQMRWPLPGRFMLSSEWGALRSVHGAQRTHTGIDIPAPAGTPICAACAGTVSTEAHWSYGICVKLDHGDGLQTVYGHMSQRIVQDGDVVEAGEVLGYVGSTGNSTGNHLHFEVDVDGASVDPFPYLND